MFDRRSGRRGAARPGQSLLQFPGDAHEAARPELARVTGSAVVPCEPSEDLGAVFTRRWVAELVLDLTGYTSDRDLAGLIAVEPACGSGAFLVPMVERLLVSCRTYGRSVDELDGAVKAYDLLLGNVEQARSSVVQVLRAFAVSGARAAELASTWIVHGDFLLDADDRRADVVVGNPPYIRLEDVPAERSEAYRRSCLTMRGRADVFVGFFDKGLRALSPDGRLGFICADRWMRNAYGRHLRATVTTSYAVDAVVNMHEVDAFEQRVSAYPAITVLRAGPPRPTLVAETTSAFDQRGAQQLVTWLASGDVEPLQLAGLTASWSRSWPTGAQSWPSAPPAVLALLSELERRLPTLSQAGVCVGIGVATGADDVYITRDTSAVESERLLPLVMRKDLQAGRTSTPQQYLINPWDDDGLVDLSQWPRLRQHLQRHQDRVLGRHVARTNPGREHRTLDRVLPGLADTPKLLLPDLAERMDPVLDEGGPYPHHNLYWLTSDRWDLRVLGGLLLSQIAEMFVAAYCVRMRGGTLRFQAQYLRRICLPHPEDISVQDRALLRQAFLARDRVTADEVAARVYGVGPVAPSALPRGRAVAREPR